ncbi:hypothetical protein [Gluconacetobacter takamatsuzukensis]|uniref:Uncharacterized protein n=1 Tax=Gluconacetobacter takamatsuzukensis TaxID=1286190 RepID=A0A7W4KBA0_9PROT|nr:hypothetical protein [Gluconacetobacter takamatsuzukensis]MBB2203764.1 hypothetical protein [Gluconacetobacter takamatsuzukensis]
MVICSVRGRLFAFGGAAVMASALSCPVAGIAAVWTPAIIEHGVTVDGAVATNRHLPQSQFDYLLKEASRGDAQWLRALASLYPGTDGARAEGMEMALSDALQTNPEEVLSLLTTYSDLPQPDRLCENREIEPTASNVRRYYDRALQAVEAVDDPMLRSVKARCLAQLRRRR